MPLYETNTTGSTGVTGDNTKYVNGAVVPHVVVLDANGNIQTMGGGGGGGGAAVDLLYVDNTGQQFIYRDNGATPPVFTAYTVPGGMLYTVGANPVPYAIKNVVVSNLPGTQPVCNSSQRALRRIS